jgi:hypothetical protein
MQQNTALNHFLKKRSNSNSPVSMYRKKSNNQITLNTATTLRKRKKRRKSETDEKLACCPQNNPATTRPHYSHSAEGEAAQGCHQAAIQPTTRNEYTHIHIHNSIMRKRNSTTAHNIRGCLRASVFVWFGCTGLI